MSLFDLIGVLATFALWFVLATRSHSGKSLSNAVTEPVLLAAVVGLLAVCRLAIGSRVSATRLRVAFYGLALLAAACVCYLTPTLPE